VRAAARAHQRRARTWRRRSWERPLMWSIPSPWIAVGRRLDLGGGSEPRRRPDRSSMINGVGEVWRPSEILGGLALHDCGSSVLQNGGAERARCGVEHVCMLHQEDWVARRIGGDPAVLIHRHVGGFVNVGRRCLSTVCL
jgi:hypothetical protein